MMCQTIRRPHFKLGFIIVLFLGVFVPKTWGETQLWDTAWILPLAPFSTIDSYLSTRAAQGFNVVMMSMTGWGTSNDPLGNGQAPFLGVLPGTKNMGDITKPNDGGFDFIDHIVRSAASHGLVVALLPLGNGTTVEYVAALRDADSAYGYGLYLGQRYRGTANLMWVLGGDACPSEDVQAVPLTRSLAQGLRDGGAGQAMTYHARGSDCGSSSVWFDSDAWLTFHMIQTGAGDPSQISMDILNDYRLGPKPTGIGETGYENDAADGERVRADAYRTYFAGGSYFTYGEIHTCCGGPYSDYLHEPGAGWAVQARDFVVRHGWKNYAPNDTLVSRGTGEWHTLQRDNSSAMIYLASSSTQVSVDMSRLHAQAMVHVERFNPMTGAQVSMGDFPASGTQTFQTGGGADAVIVLEAVSGSGAELPTVALTAPASGATLTGTVMVTATASKNAGVAGVQFQVDGTNVGAAVTTPPYTMRWDTTMTRNGAHTLTATARDAAGHTTTSRMINVTVANPEKTPHLLHQSDFTYVGAFKLPEGRFGALQDTFDDSGGFVGGNVYNDPVHGKSLFIPGALSALQVSTRVSIAQVTIPASIQDPNVVGLRGLTTATVVQGFADPSHGIGSQILTSKGFGTLLVYGGKLIGTEAVAADAACAQVMSAWVAPLNFAQSSQASGPYGFAVSVPPQILGGGFMALIPPEWRTALGGSVVSGNGPTAMMACSTPGPSLYVIDADTLLTQPPAGTPIAAQPLVSYVQDGVRNTLGTGKSNSPTQSIHGQLIPSLTVTDPHGRGTFTIAYADNAMRIHGVLFPDGTRSVLFVGRKGLGPYCYGTGGAGGGECYDPDWSGTGDHAYPYTEFVWAYDVQDLLAVKNGHQHPWEVVPYTGWALKVYGDGDGGAAVGIAWDPATRLAYMVVPSTNKVAPLVHVFRVGIP